MAFQFKPYVTGTTALFSFPGSAVDRHTIRLHFLSHAFTLNFKKKGYLRDTRYRRTIPISAMNLLLHHTELVL